MTYSIEPVHSTVPSLFALLLTRALGRLAPHAHTSYPIVYPVPLVSFAPSPLPEAEPVLLLALLDTEQYH